MRHQSCYDKSAIGSIWCVGLHPRGEERHLQAGWCHHALRQHEVQTEATRGTGRGWWDWGSVQGENAYIWCIGWILVDRRFLNVSHFYYWQMLISQLIWWAWTLLIYNQGSVPPESQSRKWVGHQGTECPAGGDYFLVNISSSLT